MGSPYISLAVKNLPAIQEPQERHVWSLGWEDPLEEGIETYCSIPAWRIPWTEEPGGLASVGSQRVGHNWNNLPCTHTSAIKATEPSKCNWLKPIPKHWMMGPSMDSGGKFIQSATLALILNWLVTALSWASSFLTARLLCFFLRWWIEVTPQHFSF